MAELEESLRQAEETVQAVQVRSELSMQWIRSVLVACRVKEMT